MSIRLGAVLAQQSNKLRREPTAKRVRAFVGAEVAVDSERTVLVWEPDQAVPTYAVPREDVVVQIIEVKPGEKAPDGAPSHDIPGYRVILRANAGGPEGSGYVADDPDLSGFVILDFSSFDRWLEEDEEIDAHPRDPFHRVDVRSTSRHIQVMMNGQLLADTVHGKLLYETTLPTRYYLPREDVLTTLTPSPTRTLCPYKGKASYWSFTLDGQAVEDLVWSYEDPLEDAAGLKGYLAFYDNKVEVLLDEKPAAAD